MLGDELHNILYYSNPSLIVKWAQMFAWSYNYYEDYTGMRMQAILDKSNDDGEGPDFYSDCGFIKYVFLEREVEAITKSLQRFMNIKVFL